MERLFCIEHKPVERLFSVEHTPPPPPNVLCRTYPPTPLPSPFARTGWLGVNHQVTYPLLTPLFVFVVVIVVVVDSNPPGYEYLWRIIIITTLLWHTNVTCMPTCACKHTDTLGVQTLYWGGEGEGEGRGRWVGVLRQIFSFGPSRKKNTSRPSKQLIGNIFRSFVR